METKQALAKINSSTDDKDKAKEWPMQLPRHRVVFYEAYGELVFHLETFGL
jgi:hypothetical protein